MRSIIMYRLIAIVSMTAFLAACDTNFRSSAPPAPSGPRLAVLTVKFNPKAANYIFDKGTASITGRAFIKASDGTTKTASGSSATLLPVTEYAEQRVNAIYGSSGVASRKVKFTKESDDPRYHVYTRTTAVGKDGKFTFSGIAAGDYFVTTGINWQAKDSSGKTSRRGIALVKRVSVAKGQTVKIILTTSGTQLASN